jgi:glycosyltransferase involved in cell wall biosynthesis
MEYAELFCDYIVPLSEWHKLYLLSRKLNFDEEYIIPFSNGVDLNRYSQKEKLLKKPWRFVYSSSPDRGLLHLLNCWPRIRDLDSEAELVVTYGVKDWIEFLKWSHSKQGEMAVDLEKLMKQNGIVDFGKVGQTQLAKLQMSAVAWPYPLDAIRATETGCISALENMAAGNPIITTDCDCMEMEFSKAAIIIPLPFNEHEFISALDFILSDEQAYATLQQQGYEFVQKRDWSIIAQKRQKFFLSL